MGKVPTLIHRYRGPLSTSLRPGKKKPTSVLAGISLSLPPPTAHWRHGRRPPSLSASPVPEISSSPISTSHPAGAPHLLISLFPDPLLWFLASPPVALQASRLSYATVGNPPLPLPGWVFDFNLYWHWGCCITLRAHYAFVLCLYPTQGQVTCLGADSHSVLSSGKIVCFKLIW
jgi:hypothetical protein